MDFFFLKTITPSENNVYDYFMLRCFVSKLPNKKEKKEEEKKHLGPFTQC